MGATVLDKEMADTLQCVRTTVWECCLALFSPKLKKNKHPVGAILESTFTPRGDELN